MEGRPVTSSSPMRPVAPPSKKQRSTTEDSLSSAADDAIARRRAELARLKQMQARKQDSKGLLDQARAQLGASDGPAPAKPPAQHIARVRHSDIFPGVTKQATAQAQAAPPPTSSRHPTPRVARRLDPSFQERTPRLPSSSSSGRAKSAPPQRPPPPPAPPKLSAESPPERTTPASTPTSMETHPPTSGRRETFSNLRDVAATPHKESNELRMVKELKRAQNEKEDALRKAARLNEQLQQMQKKEQQPKSGLETLVQVAEERGESAAVSWAREQVSGNTTTQVGFLSPPRRSGSISSLTPLANTRRRVATPHPKCKKNNPEERALLTEAANTIPHEYHSSLATYIVRRPYTTQPDAELWDVAGYQNEEAYQTLVDTNKSSTVEVVAKITADGSLLTLTGKATVRHKKASSNEWREFDDVDDMDAPLGCVTYVDREANEKEYWLDAICEETFATREAYCSSLLSTVPVLQARKAQTPKPLAPSLNGGSAVPETKIVEVVKEVVKEVESPRPPVADACVGTEGELVQEPNRREAAPAPQPKPPPEAENSSDVLTVFLGMVFSSLFGMIWLVLFRIPFRIFTFTLLLVTTGSLLSLIWVYVADDHVSQMYGFNRPGIV